LAAVALSPYYGNEIAIEAVSIAKLNDSVHEVEFASGGRDYKHFGQVVYHLLPKGSIAAGQNWSEIGFILYRGAPIGFLIPTTLVCPVRGYEKAVGSGVPWSDAGRLVDPCEVRSVRPEEYSTLAYYIKMLREGIAREVGSGAGDSSARGFDDDRTVRRGYDRVIELLAQFQADSARRAGPTSIDGAKFDAVGLRATLPQQPIYGVFRNVYVLDRPVGYGTLLAARASLRAESAPLLKGALFVDPSMPAALGVPPHQIRIWDTVTLETLCNDPKRLTAVRADAAKHGFMVLAPDDLFTQKLYRVTDGDVIRHRRCGGEGYLLPLTPLALLFFSADELVRSLRISDRRGDIEVELTLPLLGSDGRSTEYVLRRAYPSNMIIERMPPTSLSLWPNFDSEHWRYNYVFQGCDPQKMITVLAPVTERALVEILNGKELAAQRVGLAGRIGEALGERSKPLTLPDVAGVVRSLWISDRTPEALICAATDPRPGQPALRGAATGPAGLLLPPSMPRVTPDNLSWVIGIDFGTTNTAVYLRRGSDDIRSGELSNRCVTPFASRSLGAEAEHALEFLPLENRVVPFLTIQEPRRKVDTSVSRRPLWTDRVYYVGKNLARAVERVLDPKPPQLCFNMKWSNDRLVRDGVQTYLSQVALEALAEVTAAGGVPSQVEWMFSYPEAFSPDQEEQFRALHPNVVGLALDPGGTSAASAPAIKHRVESLCTAYYFRDKARAQFAGTVATIDVGGHTTDVSIWCQREMIWHGSLRFGGQNVLIDYLMEAPELLGMISSDDGSATKACAQLIEFRKARGRNQGDQALLRQAVEVIVNSSWYEENFHKALPLLAGQAEAQGLLRIGEIALFGLLCYVATVIKALVPDGKRRDSGLTLCLGGRGSRVFRSLALLGSRSSAAEGSLGKIKEAVRARADVYGVAQPVYFSSEPKHEVAYGLVASEYFPSSGRKPRRDIPSGEAFVVIGSKGAPTPKEASDFLNRLNPCDQWCITELVELKRMIKAYEEMLDRKVEIDDAIYDRIKGTINEQLADARDQAAAAQGSKARRRDSEVMTVEPIFIAALRELVGDLIRRRVPVH